MVYIPFLTSAWDPLGKHVFITGGSQGLGLALAKLCASRGADVTIVARSQEKLEKAILEVADSRLDAKTQSVAYYSSDVSTFDGAQAAMQWASTSADKIGSSSKSGGQQTPVGRTPDVVFCCAGASKPGYFLQQTESDFDSGFRTIYKTALSTSHAAADQMVKSKKKGKIVFVSSTLGLMSLVGYAQYAPMKFAIRGLAETLRSELLLYEISVHCYFPGTILSPGYEEENKTKPQLTKNLEGGPDEGLTPEQCASGLLTGVARDQFYITTDFQSELFRAAGATGGSIPGNFWLVDRVMAFIALIALPVWRIFVADREIKGHIERHQSEVGSLSSRLSRSPYKKLFLLSLLHRCLVLFCLLFLPLLLLRPFDTSAQLQIYPNGGNLFERSIANLIRWDSLHFLGLASPTSLPAIPRALDSGMQDDGGYHWEQSLAFQPGLVWLMRLCGGGASHWAPPASIIVTSLLAVLASSVAPVLLYHILVSTPLSPSTSAIASLLSILSPSPSTLVTPTPEPFFAFFGLLGLAFLSPKIDMHSRQTLLPGYFASPGVGIALSRLILASISFAIATAFRANGIIMVGYLLFHCFWTRSHSATASRPPLELVQRLVLAVIASLITVSPFLLGQLWAWDRFCNVGLHSGAETRPWCEGGMRGVYGFVQDEYWNNGFLRYWSVSQLPNFVLALPVLLIAYSTALRFYRNAGLVRILKVSTLGCLYPTALLDGSEREYALWMWMLPHIHYSVILSTLLTFFSHVQIALRFATPAWVGLWVGIAQLVLGGESDVNYEEQKKEEDQVTDLLQPKTNVKDVQIDKEVTAVRTDPRQGFDVDLSPLWISTGRGKVVLTWLVGWNVLSVVLYAAFLPPA